MVKSPCIDVCEYNDGVCVGCKRTSDEIANWLVMSDREKIECLKRCEKRKTKNFL